MVPIVNGLHLLACAVLVSKTDAGNYLVDGLPCPRLWPSDHVSASLVKAL